MSNLTGVFEKIDDYRWRIPRSFKTGMLTDGIIYASAEMLELIISENAHQQVANVACLPGIIGSSLAMPDIHLGYGFPIGGVAAFDPESGGVVSPGGVGYDINCGVRLLRTHLQHKEIIPKINDLIDRLASEVPSGVGAEGTVSLSNTDLDRIIQKGAGWSVEHGYGTAEDLLHSEENGCVAGADPAAVSKRARERGTGQQGMLGSGNHFLEVQVVEEIFDEKAANAFGLGLEQITIMIHSGSRGFGHQICTDYIAEMNKAAIKYGINLPDRQLCCAPINSPVGQTYLGAMRAAANYAWANRQLLMHWTQDAFARAVGGSPADLGISLIYDVAHNIAKMENHLVNGKKKLLCVHRKGATRAFPAGRPEVPADYRSVGQPVLVPGDMGRYSYVMVGTERVLNETWGSACHGAGRQLSRSAATRKYTYQQLSSELKARGVEVRTANRIGLVEEAPGAYKDVKDVVEVVQNSGLANKVARLRPLAVVKG